MTGNGTVSNGSTTTTNFYNADLTGTTGYTTSTPTATVTKSGKTITVTLSFSAQVPTFFMGVIGYSNIAIFRNVHVKLHAADIYRFLPDDRRVGIDELPFDGKRAGAAASGQS